MIDEKMMHLSMFVKKLNDDLSVGGVDLILDDLRSAMDDSISIEHRFAGIANAHNVLVGLREVVAAIIDNLNEDDGSVLLDKTIYEIIKPLASCQKDITGE